ncbi:YraN family protein [Rhodospirillum sp. A1_3_36]|uniref:YraN family protein n=1 Tax=Rhodospirillum sp. A1_3_36 TaxID=3391666 RepID=UPI0039A5F411
MSGRSQGRWAETLCTVWLLLTGWRILARRFLVGRGTGAGEVDIIARRGRVLAFIEVKTRPTLTQGLDAVTPRQRQRIQRGAEVFLARNRIRGGAIDSRFDVMVVTGFFRLHHTRDAWRVGL